MATKTVSSRPWDDVLGLLPGYDPTHDAEGFTFEPAKAAFAVEFFSECLTHVEGPTNGKPLTLEPWQQAIIANLFGWVRDDNGSRRYREAFIFVPRKNGKTTLVAGLVNFLFFCDDEPGAQIFLAAAERDQASLCFGIAAQMVRSEPHLAKRCDIWQGRKSMVLKANYANGKPAELKAISADANTKHGFNVHCAVIDELHAQPNRDLVDVLQTGTGARRQPLIIHITTSDFDRPSICNEKHEYASKVRDGIISDPSFLPAIWEATREDDWTTEETWKKANPNYGISVTKEYLERECKRAQESPAYENTFKRLHLNIRTEQDVRWMAMGRWDESDGALPDLKEKQCFAGLDLASTSDIAALVLLFPGNPMAVVPYFWIPRETAKKRDRDARVPYISWINQGLITATDGDATDFDVIRRDINELRKKYTIKEIAFDPWNALQLSNQLASDGFELIKFGQTIANMNEPVKRLERLVHSKQIVFGNNPVLRWMASNVTLHEDHDGKVRPDRKKSTEKIDGIVALTMAIGRWLAHSDKTSVYQSRGLVTL